MKILEHLQRDILFYLSILIELQVEDHIKLAKNVIKFQLKAKLKTMQFFLDDFLKL